MVTIPAHGGITAVNERVMAVFNAGNAAAVAAFYTTTGLLMPPRTEAIAGREWIQTYWQGAMDRGSATLQVDARSGRLWRERY